MKLIVSSGADIHTTNFIISDNIVVKATSGSDQELAIKATNINCSLQVEQN